MTKTVAEIIKSCPYASRDSLILRTLCRYEAMADYDQQCIDYEEACKNRDLALAADEMVTAEELARPVYQDILLDKLQLLPEAQPPTFEEKETETWTKSLNQFVIMKGGLPTPQEYTAVRAHFDNGRPLREMNELIQIQKDMDSRIARSNH